MPVGVSAVSGLVWSSRSLFVMALAGTTIGLGNVWRFPYLAGEYGGGAFLVAYVGCLIAVGMPLMIAELMLGREGRASPVRSYAAVARGEGATGAWAVIAVGGSVAAIMLLAAYSVVGGWSLAYVFRAAGGSLEGLDAVDAARVFRDLTSDPERLLAWHTLFIAVTMLIVGRGLRQGLEAAIAWFMPLLLGLLLVLVFTASAQPGFGQALRFLTAPDLSRLGTGGLLAALGHAFFSLTLGVGAVAAFGRYAERRLPLMPVTLAVIVLDTVVALLAGLATLPFLFSLDLAPSAGTGLVFQTLPLAFGELVGGRYLATLFFAALVLAAWTSAIAMMEPMVAWLAERVRVDRALATSMTGLLVWIVGVFALLSFNRLAHVSWLPSLPGMVGNSLFELMNHVAINLMLPVLGLATAVFVGWRVSATTQRHGVGGRIGFRLWRVLIRFVTPLAMLVIMAQATGLLRTLGPL